MVNTAQGWARSALGDVQVGDNYLIKQHIERGLGKARFEPSTLVYSLVLLGTTVQGKGGLALAYAELRKGAFTLRNHQALSPDQSWQLFYHLWPGTPPIQANGQMGPSCHGNDSTRKRKQLLTHNTVWMIPNTCLFSFIYVLFILGGGGLVVFRDYWLCAQEFFF